MGIEQNVEEEEPMALCTEMPLGSIALVKDVDDVMSLHDDFDINPLSPIKNLRQYLEASYHLSSCSICMRNYNLMDENHVPTPSPMGRMILTPRYG